MADSMNAAADEIADELIRTAAESPDGLALLDRIIERICQARYIVISPLREV